MTFHKSGKLIEKITASGVVMEKLKLNELIEQVKMAMRDLEYKEKTISGYNSIFRELESFAASIGEEEFSEALGVRFLEERYDYPSHYQVSDHSSRAVAAVRTVRMLGGYQLYGGFYRRHPSKESVAWAMDDVPAFEAFFKKMTTVDTAERTKKTIIFRIRKFYDFLCSSGIKSVKEITTETLSAYVLSLQGNSKRYVQEKIKVTRRYLSFLYKTDYLQTDIGNALPAIKAARNKNIPAIWNKGDLEKLLISVDRGNPVGKRDYAILLLVSGLGLRVSDIGNLKFPNINWLRKEIEISQHKTGRLNVCPLTDEAGWAIIDYLRYGRPKSDLPHVFLSCVPPYREIGDSTATHILRKYMRRCGIHEDTSGISKGMHSLRHALARNLLDQNVPLELITDIMGHTQVVSASPYLKIDVNGLRQCALSLSEVEKYATVSDL